MEVRSGSKDIPLSEIRLYGMGVPLNRALNMNGSLHLTIGYLLRIEHGGFGVIVLQLVG